MIKHQVLGPCQRNSFEEVGSAPSALWTRAMFNGEVPQGELSLIFYANMFIVYQVTSTSTFQISSAGSFKLHLALRHPCCELFVHRCPDWLVSY